MHAAPTHAAPTLLNGPTVAKSMWGEEWSEAKSWPVLAAQSDEAAPGFIAFSGSDSPQKPEGAQQRLAVSSQFSSEQSEAWQ